MTMRDHDPRVGLQTDALTIAWDAFRDAAGDDLVGWEVTAAAAEVQPGPPLTAAAVRSARIGLAGRTERAGH